MLHPVTIAFGILFFVFVIAFIFVNRKLRETQNVDTGWTDGGGDTHWMGDLGDFDGDGD